MQNNKYYTPDISELYVGYECFWIKDLIKDITKDNLIPITFTSKKLSSTLFPPIQWEHEDTDNFKPNLMSYRTKFLDSDDIISLGFTVNALSEYKKGDIYIVIYTDNKILIQDDNKTKYYGRCKSKNELKTILSWIR
jgi:hypothetical protein